jgi:hypothetical protein
LGGGIREVKEARKAPILSPHDSDRSLPPDGQGVGAAGDLSLPLCERSQIVAFQLMKPDGVEVGAAVRVVLGTPPAIVLDRRTIGHLTDRRQAETIAACMSSGYLVSGEIVTLDEELREGFAVVAGVRAGG